MLHNDLKNLDKYPFHMPGHKRNKAFDITASDIDITEIEGFDNLHCATGSIKEIEQKLSKLYNSKRSFALINGSTVGLLTAIFSVCNRGDDIIIARNCHKSVYNACFMKELNVTYIEPNYDKNDGYYLNVTQDEVDIALKKSPNAKAVVITSPTYEGNISKIEVPTTLIIDSAHGAHFGFANFPTYPKADIVISSLHKTLPSLTQTAVINVYNEKFIKNVKMYLDILQTSSPSYILLSSISKCTQIMEHSDNLFIEYENNLHNFYENTKLKNLIFKIGDDIGKVVVSTSNANITGKELSDILRNKYNLECEMASVNYIILMTSIADTKDAFLNLSNALIEIDEKLQKVSTKYIDKIEIPKAKNKICEIEKSEKTLLKKSENKICAEYIYAYPPDIPIIVPGEVISANLINNIEKMIKNDINIVSDSNLLPCWILTKSDK